MFGLPFGLVEQALRLINNLLEARSPAQRNAEARIWFWKFWPILRIGIKKEQREQIEAIMNELAPEKPSNDAVTG